MVSLPDFDPQHPGNPSDDAHMNRETLGVYVPTPRKATRSADLAELRAAADRLAETLADLDEEQVVTEFKQMRRRSKASIPAK